MEPNFDDQYGMGETRGLIRDMAMDDYWAEFPTDSSSSIHRDLRASYDLNSKLIARSSEILTMQKQRIDLLEWYRKRIRARLDGG